MYQGCRATEEDDPAGTHRDQFVEPASGVRAFCGQAQGYRNALILEQRDGMVRQCEVVYNRSESRHSNVEVCGHDRLDGQLRYFRGTPTVNFLAMTKPIDGVEDGRRGGGVPHDWTLRGDFCVRRARVALWDVHRVAMSPPSTVMISPVI